MRATRNVLVHRGLASTNSASAETAIENAIIVQAFARLESIVAQIDELEFDSRQSALQKLVMPPAIADMKGSTAVFCASTATAEYVDHGLRVLGLAAKTLTRLRHEGPSLGEWLDSPGAITVLTDPQLKGLDLTGTRQAINYDLPTTPERLAIRSTRLQWTERPWLIWTLLPGSSQLERREREVLEWGPYLSAHHQRLG